MTPPTSFGVPNALKILEQHPNTLKHFQHNLKVLYHWCFRCFRSQVVSLRLEYMERAGNASISLQWESLSLSKEVRG